MPTPRTLHFATKSYWTPRGIPPHFPGKDIMKISLVASAMLACAFANLSHAQQAASQQAISKPGAISDTTTMGGAAGFAGTVLMAGSMNYQYDNGISSDAFGWPGNCLMFMHAFDSGGSDTITKNSAAFGTPVFPSMPPGAAITLGI